MILLADSINETLILNMERFIPAVTESRFKLSIELLTCSKNNFDTAHLILHQTTFNYMQPKSLDMIKNLSNLSPNNYLILNLLSCQHLANFQ